MKRTIVIVVVVCLVIIGSVLIRRYASGRRTGGSEELNRQLEMGNLTQLRLAFEIYTQTHNGRFPAKMEDVLDEDMRGYLICPIHKIPYVYHQPTETVKQIRDKYWKEEEQGKYTVTGKAPVLVECSEPGHQLKLRADLTTSR